MPSTWGALPGGGRASLRLQWDPQLRIGEQTAQAGEGRGRALLGSGTREPRLVVFLSYWNSVAEQAAVHQIQKKKEDTHTGGGDMEGPGRHREGAWRGAGPARSGRRMEMGGAGTGGRGTEMGGAGTDGGAWREGHRGRGMEKGGAGTEKGGMEGRGVMEGRTCRGAGPAQRAGSRRGVGPAQRGWAHSPRSGCPGPLPSVRPFPGRS